MSINNETFFGRLNARTEFGVGNKIFGLGLSRTGTKSLTKALNNLRIRTIHFPHDLTTQMELFSGRGDLTILECYQGVVDGIAPFYAQLDRANPDSKFILTIREKEAWVHSAQIHFTWVAKQFSNFNARFQEFAQLITERVYGSIDFNRVRFLDAYEQHVRDVLSYFKERPEQLLVMDITGGDGWEKLCPFVGVPMPLERFPYILDREKLIDTGLDSC